MRASISLHFSVTNLQLKKFMTTKMCLIALLIALELIAFNVQRQCAHNLFGCYGIDAVYVYACLAYIENNYSLFHFILLLTFVCCVSYESIHNENSFQFIQSIHRVSSHIVKCILFTTEIIF